MEVLNEQQRFIHCLHHACHDSFVVRWLKGKGQFSSRCLSELESYDSHYDSYISLHGFTRYGRKSEHIRELTCIYYDLDLHRKRGNIDILDDIDIINDIINGAIDEELFWKRNNIDEYIHNTLNIINWAIKDEKIPEPTMITRTGRGLGLFYVLEKSIGCSKGRNAGQVAFWNLIYRRLGKKIKELLVPENNVYADDPEEILEFDTRILCDYSRVTRMPMTVNQATGERCSIISMPYSEGRPRYYSLKELSGYVFPKTYNGKKTYTKRKRKKNNIVYVDFSREIFLRERLHAMELLQEQRNGECTGTRDYMCFVYYNHAVQIYGAGQAVEKLKRYNNGFNEPLPDGELCNLVKGVNRNKGDSYEGYYRLTNKWILEKCGITQEEEKQSGMKLTKRNIDRIMAKETTARRRMERNRELCVYIKEHPEEKYKDIAKIFGVSIRTLQEIVKAAGIHRYKKKTEENVPDAPKVLQKKRKCQKCKNLSHSICCASCPMSVGAIRESSEDYPEIGISKIDTAVIDTG